jgi:hypothetical protein
MPANSKEHQAFFSSPWAGCRETAGHALEVAKVLWKQTHRISAAAEVSAENSCRHQGLTMVIKAKTLAAK